MPQNSYQQYANSGVPNISYGSSFPDGLRVGPSLLNAQPWVDATPQNPFFQPPITQPGLNWLGNGVLLSPVTTYGISTLYGAQAIPASTTVTDAVKNAVISNPLTGTAATLNATFTIIQNIKFSSTLFNQFPFANIDVGNPVGFQMDWPRVVGLYVSAATSNSETAPVSIRVSGYDWYGNRMTEVITLPSATLTGGNSICVLGNKAFYLVTKITLITPPAKTQTTIQPVFGNRWGLPYRLFRTAHFITASFVTNNSTTYAGNASISLAGIKIGSGKIFATTGSASGPLPAADQYYGISYIGGNLFQGDGTPEPSPATYATNDVRGTFDLANIADSTSTPIFNKDTAIILSLTYYVQGANVWQNQGNALQWPDAVSKQTVESVEIPVHCEPMTSLRDVDLYGIQQAFYPGDFT